MSDQLFGPMLREDGHCEWRLWAPKALHAELILFDKEGFESAAHRMYVQKYGCFACELDGVTEGQQYAFRLDGRSPRPDPASRWQPHGVHQPSALWRADAFQWTDHSWHGIALQDLVIYEIHVGTFTPDGTFAAAVPRLKELLELGVTAIELMPVGQFPGERGWGYDAAYWFAVQQSYGGPAELQRFVDACHAHGLGVILDVVYNHLGPEGNYLGEFGPFFTDRHQTPWGAAINYDGSSCRAVRSFVLDNIRQWIRDFHVDGLRLDAVHAIFDDSPTHILAEIKQTASEEAERIGWPVHVIAESNLNDTRLLDLTSTGGYGLDAQWSDDFHHCVHALLTGERDGYYADFDSPTQQLVKVLNDVFVHDGCFSQFRGRNHGTPVGLHSGERFVVSIQTHDQVGNRARGDRFGTLLDPVKQRLAAGLLLLSPYIPQLFMGEEYGEQRPFPFFCDFGDESLREAVRRGRQEEFASFAWAGELPDPMSRQTFESAILTWSWPKDTVHSGLRELYHDLLSLRRSHPALRDFRQPSAQLLANADGAEVLLLIRGDSQTPKNRLLSVFNLSGKSAKLPSHIRSPDELLLYSDEARFGGSSDTHHVLSELNPFEFAVFRKVSHVSLEDAR